MRSVEITNPVACITPAIASASPSEMTQPQSPSVAGLPRIARKSIYSGKEEEESEAGGAEERDDLAGRGQIEHVRADEDPGEDLDHDDRDAHALRNPREEGRRGRDDSDHEQAQKLALHPDPSRPPPAGPIPARSGARTVGTYLAA
jgi:hypothetical protein